MKGHRKEDKINMIRIKLRTISKCSIINGYNGSLEKGERIGNVQDVTVFRIGTYNVTFC
jgi:hypothetical protein